MLWILIAVAVLLILWRIREGYVDPERAVTRPSMDSATWKSKVDAQAPIDSDDAKYIEVLQKFYDNVYVPAETKPKDTQVEEFLKSTDAAGVDVPSMRKIILSSFSIDRTATIQAREQQQTKFVQSDANLQPKNAVDPLARPEDPYTPADARTGELPEGIYAPVTQQPNPRRSGAWDDKSTSWTDAQFASVCECAKNVV